MAKDPFDLQEVTGVTFLDDQNLQPMLCAPNDVRGELKSLNVLNVLEEILCERLTKFIIPLSLNSIFIMTTEVLCNIPKASVSPPTHTAFFRPSVSKPSSSKVGTP
jgi:hypothetical protein